MNLIVGICLLAVAVCPYGLLCQNIKYSYDNAGNRVKREIVLPQRNMPDGHVKAKVPVSEMLGNKNIRIYPNPTSGVLKIEVAGFEDSDKGNLSIFNLSGQQLLNSDIISTFTELDISSSQKGVYILLINLNGESTTWKIIKE